MNDFKNRNNEAERRATEQRDIDHIMRICARGRDVITGSSRMFSRRLEQPAVESNEMLELITLIER